MATFAEASQGADEFYQNGFLPYTKTAPKLYFISSRVWRPISLGGYIPGSLVTGGKMWKLAKFPRVPELFQTFLELTPMHKGSRVIFSHFARNSSSDWVSFLYALMHSTIL